MAEQKNILVVIPTTEETQQRMQAAVEGGQYDCNFTFMPIKVPTKDDLASGANISLELMREVTAEDLAGQQVIIGAVPPSLLKTADSLEWLQHLLALTFALIRHIPEYVRNQEQHLWKQNPWHISVEGSTVVALGLGDIGGDYARKMKALGAYVIGVRRDASKKPDYCDEVVALDELNSVLPRADIVAASLPGGEATFHLINEERLRLMKPGAYFINVGRGNVLDQEAAKRVLADGHLGGLGLDVFESEPLPEDDELWNDDRVLVTPHVAGQFFLQTTFDRMVDICVNNLHAWSHGEALSTQVNRELGY